MQCTAHPELFLRLSPALRGSARGCQELPLPVLVLLYWGQAEGAPTDLVLGYWVGYRKPDGFTEVLSAL